MLRALFLDSVKIKTLSEGWSEYLWAFFVLPSVTVSELWAEAGGTGHRRSWCGTEVWAAERQRLVLVFVSLCERFICLAPRRSSIIFHWDWLPSFILVSRTTKSLAVSPLFSEPALSFSTLYKRTCDTSGHNQESCSLSGFGFAP